MIYVNMNPANFSGVGERVIFININPIAFTIGPFTVGWYGIMVALAVMTMVAWALYQVKKNPVVSTDKMVNIALVAIPSGIVFSRLLHVIDNIVVAKLHPELASSGAVIDYTQHLSQIIGGAGLSIWGAVMGAALGVWIYSRFSKMPYGRLADLLAPGIILAQAVGRVGCTILGDDTGLPTSLPWGVIYTSPNSPTNQVMGLIATHPVVTYEIIFNLLAFGALLLLRNKLRPDGSLFTVYLALYSVWRIGGDFLRTGNPFLFGLHQAQVISIIVLIIAMALLIWRTRWVRKGEEKGILAV